MGRIRARAVVGIAVALLLVVGAVPTVASESKTHGRIAFVTYRTGNTEIFAMNADGSNPVDLTNNASPDGYPSWSQDGRTLAFVRGRGPGRDLWVMDADGGHQHQITATPGIAELASSWSRDGHTIAVVRLDYATFTFSIWLVDVDGSRPDRLLTDAPAFNGWPDWSPDGTWITFTSDREGANAVYRVRPDGTEIARLTPLGMNAGNATWSPDGERIAFSDNTCGVCPMSHVWVMELGDRELTQITAGPDNDLFATWSPDGEWLAFERSFIDVTGGLLPPDIFVVPSEGGAAVNLTASPGVFDSLPRWQPSHRARPDD